MLSKIASVLNSRRFYVFVLLFFAFESIWIALSAVYPQAFDEDFHFGLIRVYSHYWLPFLSHQPANANAYGAVAHDPSFLYHYLMSFPYRLLALFIHSQAGQVIALRLLDIGLFAAGLTLFRRLLMRTGLSQALVNVSLFLLVLIPIVPQLAAQVNYDDMLFPLVAWACLLAYEIIDELRERRPSARSLLTLSVVLFLSTLVKYAFLPVLASIAIFVLAYMYSCYRHNLKQLLGRLKDDFKAQSQWVKVVLPLTLVVALVFFVRRDVVNVIQYHSVVPDCAKVLSVKDCSAYSAWYVDYQRHQAVLAGTPMPYDNLALYTWQWFYWMWYRLFFAVNGPASNFYTARPLPLPSYAAVILGIGGLLALFKWRRRLFPNNPHLLMLVSICLIYIASLFVKGYATYHYTAVLENMNGRYLVPILLPLAAILGLAISRSLGHLEWRKAAVAAVVIVLFLEGGGVLTFMLRSDESWYWPNDTVKRVNHTANNVTNHVVVKGRQ